MNIVTMKFVTKETILVADASDWHYISTLEGYFYCHFVTKRSMKLIEGEGLFFITLLGKGQLAKLI